MPLPTNISLALLPASRPGDAIHTKPKQAMLVRMSSQTLDALDTQSHLQFEFGDSPAIYIGDKCFPMQHSQESSIHELYLRASSATKKNAPLKLYANVVAKFAVERELADDLRDKIRESTQDAAAQRNTRTTVMLDTPPDLPSTTNSRKRKEPPAQTIFRKPLRPADKPKPIPVASTSSSSSKPPVPSNSTPRDLHPLRKRMIQCLAVSERTEDQVVRLVAGSAPTADARRDVLDVLEQIAEPTSKPSSDKSPRTYRLRPASWTEARPYEWTGLSEAERTSIARFARLALQTLNIPESDPAWSHVRYRNSGSNPSTSSEHSRPNTSEDRLKKQDVAPKRGVSSRDTKEKKPKPKADPRAEIMMKDESKPIRTSNSSESKPDRPPDRRAVENARATPSDRDSKRGDAAPSRRTNDYNEIPPARRPPPTDIKSAKSSSRQEDSPSIAASKHQKQPDRERPAVPSASAPKIEEEKSLSSQRIKKIRRETQGGGASDSDRERPLADRQRAKDKVVVKKEVADSPRDELRTSSAPKRKVAADYDDDEFRDSKAHLSMQKRRKTEPVEPIIKRERDDRPKDKDTTSKRPVNEPRPPTKQAPRASTSASSSKPKVKHESPSPPLKRSASSSTHARYSPADSPVSSNLNQSSHSHKSGSAKPRRRSPIYTSSEEEDTALSKRPPPPPPKNKPSASATNNSHTARDREAPSRSLPTDHAALRARYSSSYLEYLTSFQRLVRQKGKLDSMLKSNNLGSTGSITDSDGDTELMDSEELAQLTNNHKKLREELESIQQAFGRTTKSGDPMPAPEMLAA